MFGTYFRDVEHLMVQVKAGAEVGLKSLVDLSFWLIEVVLSFKNSGSSMISKN